MRVMLSKLSPERTILLDAAALLREHGHCKYAIRDGHGRMCVVGALNFAVGKGWGFDIPADRFGTPNERWECLSKATRRLRELLGLSPEGLVAWNNADERTGDEVIAALERAALTEIA